MDVYLYVIGGNVDGSNQLALQFQVPNAFVNGTGLCGIQPGSTDPTKKCMIDIFGVVPNEVHTIYSSFGPVNDLLITRALAMLMQTNANLFTLSKNAVLEAV